MDGWMDDGWMEDGWMDGWMDRYFFSITLNHPNN